MNISKTFKEWNWRRNFLFKKIKLYLRFLPLICLDRLFARKTANPNLAVKRILLIRNDLIGDMAVSTGLIRNLSQAGYEVYVSSNKQALEIIRNSPYVNGAFRYDGSGFISLIRSIASVRKHRFDLAVELRVSRDLSFYDTLYHGLIKTDILLGFNKQTLRVFNQSIFCNLQRAHVTEPFRLLLDYLNIENTDISYELLTDNDTETYVKTYIPNKKFAAVNPFGSKQARCLSDRQIKTILNNLEKWGYQPVLIGEPHKIQNIKIDNLHLFPSRNINDVIAFIKHADLVVTVDTAVVHIAAAFSANTVGLYLNIPHPLDESTPETDNLLKHRLNIDFFTFRARTSYGLTGISDDSLPYFFNSNNTFWAPNNPNAAQLFFDTESISSIHDDELSQRIDDVLSAMNAAQRQ